MIAPPAIIFPWLSSQDSDLKIVDVEGSGSLFEPILALTKGEGGKDEQFNILPTGSAGGRESLSNKSIKLALTSLSSKSSEGSSQQTGEFTEAIIAKDPIVLVHNKGSTCSFFSSGSSSGEEQSNELLKKVFERNGERCDDLVLFLREGGYDRSNLNKTVLSKSSTSNLQKLQIREVPENNFLAFEKFRRENYKNSAIFFPKSFTELNKDWFSNYEIKTCKPQTTNSGNNDPSPQKELNLLFRKETTSETSNSLWDTIKKILFKTKNLHSNFQFTPQAYCDSESNGTQDQKCESMNGNGYTTHPGEPAKDIKELKGNSGPKKK